MRPQALMLFAAGHGTRMGALTRTRPKPLIEVAGRPLIDHALALAKGKERVVVNTHAHAEQLAAHLHGRPGLALSHERELLETGGGLRAALPLLGEDPVFTLNSDAIWTGANPLDTLAAAWEPQRMDALLLLVPVAAARGNTRAGDFAVGEDGRLTWGGPMRYTGAQIIRTEGLARIPDKAFSLLLVWREMVAAGRAFGVVHSGGWCDVGHPQGIAEAEAMLREAGHV